MSDEERVIAAMKEFAQVYFVNKEYDKYALAIEFIKDFDRSYF